MEETKQKRKKKASEIMLSSYIQETEREKHRQAL